MASHDDNSNGDSRSNWKEEHESLAEAFEGLSTTPRPLCEREKVTIHVTFYISGKTFQIHLDPSTTIGQLKTHILNHPVAIESVGLYPKRYRERHFTFIHEEEEWPFANGGKEWPNFVNRFDFKLEHVKLEAGFHLVVMFRRKICLKVDSEGPFSKYFAAKQEEEDGENKKSKNSNLTCHINMVDLLDTVAQLQSLIRQQLDIPPSENFFLQNSTGVVLPDPNALIYSIELPRYGHHRTRYGGHYFTLVPCALSLQTLDGKKAWLAFTRDTTLNQFKCDVQNLTGIPLHRQSLLVEDEGLEPTPSSSATQTMAEAGITSNFKLFVLDVAREHVLSSPSENPTGSAAAGTSTGCCSISKTEYRALPLWQLKRAARELLLRCMREGWTSTDPKRKGQLLQTQEVTLYDFVHHYLEPITLERKCSYAELVSAKPVAPQWFVSHWWGAPVLHLLGCLERHARDHCNGWSFDNNAAHDGTDPDDTTYWICAFSNNQHQINTEGLGGDPSQTSFCRAMKLAQGIVTVLDDDMTVFSRVWCGYEMYMALCGFEAQGVSKSYEIYTDNSKHFHHNALDASWHTIKYKYPCPFVGVNDRMVAHYNQLRPSDFPSLRKALDVHVETGEASYEDDRRRILNSICGNITDDGAPPPEAHEAYDKVNATLRGKIALATYRLALERGEDMDKYRKAIAHYPNVRIARVDFKDCTAFRDEAKHFMVHLPICLVSLELDYSHIHFVASSEFGIGLSRLENLTRLSLRLVDCYLKSIDALCLELSSMANLQDLEMDFSKSLRITSSREFRLGLSQLENLTRLSLRLVDCYLESIDALCLELSSMANLQDLEMDFSNCTWLLGVGNAISKALGKLGKLRRLSLNFRNTYLKTADLVLMGNQICTMSSLEDCRLEVGQNLFTTSLSSFFLKVPCRTRCYPNLKHLEMNFCGCKLSRWSILDFRWSILDFYRQAAQVLNPTTLLKISFERDEEVGYGEDGETESPLRFGWTGPVEELINNQLPVLEEIVKELDDWEACDIRNLLLIDIRKTRLYGFQRR